MKAELLKSAAEQFLAIAEDAAAAPGDGRIGHELVEYLVDIFTVALEEGGE